LKKYFSHYADSIASKLNVSIIHSLLIASADVFVQIR